MIAAVSALILCSVALASAPAAATGAEPAVARHVLPNGVTVLVRESRVAQVVGVTVVVPAGARTETDGSGGVSSLLHRVMVRGTLRRSREELLDATEDGGGSLDASADVDFAEVRGQALSRHWERLLELVAEVVLEPALAADEIERARRLMLGDLRRREDQPLSFALEALNEALYAPHPYARPTHGRATTIGALDRAALLARYRESYRPEHAVIAVSGDIPGARVVRAAQRLFGTWRSAIVPAAPVPPPPGAPGDRRIVPRPGEQARVLFGYVGPSIHESDYAAVKVLSAVLGAGMGSRLFGEVRDRRGLAYSVSVVNASRVGPSAVVAYLGTAPANADAAEAAVRTEIERVRTAPPTDDELARAKTQVLASLAFDRRTQIRHAWHLAFFEMVGLGWDFPGRFASMVERVTAADVVAAASRRLANPTVVVVQPPR